MNVRVLTGASGACAIGSRAGGELRIVIERVEKTRGRRGEKGVKE